jgi:AraC family transcriptional regulator of adaptative response / DNA-3-methyladenine glycosylase II
LALPGIGSWSADIIAVHGLTDPDVLLVSDLGVRKAAAMIGFDLTDGRPDLSPWRSYVTNHLYTALD